jgi:hypothetical protein
MRFSPSSVSQFKNDPFLSASLLPVPVSLGVLLDEDVLGLKSGRGGTGGSAYFNGVFPSELSLSTDALRDAEPSLVPAATTTGELLLSPSVAPESSSREIMLSISVIPAFSTGELTELTELTLSISITPEPTSSISSGEPSLAPAAIAAGEL